jgi:hypothetical protein
LRRFTEKRNRRSGASAAANDRYIGQVADLSATR